MNTKTILSGIARLAAVAVVGTCLVGGAQVASASEEGKTPHYPIEHPKHAHWSFAGPFGHWDIGQLQRGLKVYKEVCSACHGLRLVAFRNLEELGYNEEQVKAFAAEYTVTDGPNSDGEMFERPAVPADRFPSPFPNTEAAAAANNGAAPPDFSLIAKARAPERGFPTFVFDVFTLYAENGPDYIYSLMTGYQDAPAGMEVPEGAHYNPYFVGGPALAMAAPLSDGVVSYEDGTPETVDQYSKDIAAFTMWAAEPSLVERKAMGFRVMIFLVIFAMLLYFTKKSVWSALKD
ncbi:MAG: cytochrome c1 [Rhizobiaceae bacterium]